MKIFDRNADACVVSRVGLVALLASILLAAAPSRAAVAESDIAQDSVLQLAEVASGGSYQTLNVRLDGYAPRSIPRYWSLVLPPAPVMSAAGSDGSRPL